MLKYKVKIKTTYYKIVVLTELEHQCSIHKLRYSHMVVPIQNQQYH
jgi:hypothetical protein